MLRPAEVAQVVPCEACGGPAPEGWQVWGCRLCAACRGAWDVEPAFDQVAVDAALPAELQYGPPQGVTGFRPYPAGLEGQALEDWRERRLKAGCAEYTRRTRAWVEARRAELVPARVLRPFGREVA